MDGVTHASEGQGAAARPPTIPLDGMAASFHMHTHTHAGSTHTHTLNRHMAPKNMY